MGVLDRVTVDRKRLTEPDPWYLRVPALATLAEHGLDLDDGVTVVVGENGTGKSTFVEALAQAWSSSLHSAVEHWGPRPFGEDAALHRALVLTGEWPRPAGGCFLRAEAMHELFSEVDRRENLFRTFDGRLNDRSHGESFLAYLESRVFERGLFVLDEPEAALSFTSCLRLLALLGAMVDRGSQVVLATHSPLLAAFPDATILEFGPDGMQRSEWADLELVDHWRAFFDAPGNYLRHLF